MSRATIRFAFTQDGDCRVTKNTTVREEQAGEDEAGGTAQIIHLLEFGRKNEPALQALIALHQLDLEKCDADRPQTIIEEILSAVFRAGRMLR